MLPGGTHARELIAGAVLAGLSLTAGIGRLLSAGGRPEPVAAPAPDAGLQFTAHAVSTGGITTATGIILVVLVIGAGLIGMVFFAPTTQRRPRRSEAAAEPSDRIEPVHSSS
ncbi:hypothetical protein [Nocardia blacklockiae]|uniref:hypothetical protein n=1 Tax=Nocardia blacklockiae TaxID=480036 RepID=UPI001892DA2F|nr:hypothetical protein [Nocardia blacklockiae]MBF6172389.1 hypothetical protein [Nocardia blacklockiae]